MSIFLKRIWEDDNKKSIAGDIINYNKDDNMNAPKKILLIKFISIIIIKIKFWLTIKVIITLIIIKIYGLIIIVIKVLTKIINILINVLLLVILKLFFYFYFMNIK